MLRRPLVLLAATLALRLPALVRPFFFSSDEAVYSALAMRMLHGVDPYAGAVDHKPVGVDLVYAAVAWMAGPDHMLAVHLLLVLVVWTTALVIGRIGLALVSRDAAWIAAVLYVCFSAAGMPRDVQPANTELLLNLPTVLAAWLVCGVVMRRAERSPAAELIRLVSAGALTGVAALFKYQAALVGIAWAIALAGASRAPGPLVRRLSALALGFCLVAAALCGWFYVRGEWDAFAFWGWSYNFRYIAALTTREMLGNLVVRTATVSLFWVPLVLLALMAAAVRRVPAVVVAWLAAECAAVSVGGRFFLYYYLIVLPPLCLAAAAGAATVLARRRAWRLALVVLGAGSLAVSAVLAWNWERIRPDFRREQDTVKAVGDYVRTHASPDDRLFVWGNSSQVYYFAHRVMGTRFAFCNYHTGKIWGSWSYAVDAGDTSRFVVPRAWTELLADLDRTPPAFIVDAAAGHLANFDRHPVGRYPELARRIAAAYRLDAVVAGVPIYRRQAR